MKRTVWTFGSIAGVILSAMMLALVPFRDTITFDHGTIIGYTSLVAAFLLIFFGIRSYRDNVAGGTVSFGRAVAVGALITAIASVCYVATWQIVYFKLWPNFTAQYQAHMLENARADGATQAEIEQKTAEMEKWAKMYDNPVFNVAFTFIEPVPVGLVITLVSAAVLRRRRPRAVTAARVAVA